jgi:radical SAM protein with 4Fe4S-binding SPASM domain
MNDDLPTVLQLEVTARCNLACVFCKNTLPIVQQRGDLDLGTCVRLLDRLATCCTRVNLWGTGEPMMHRDLYRIALYASERGYRRIKLSTNGHFLTDRNIDRLLSSGFTCIRVSLDHATAQEYEHVRVGGDFARVVDGIRRLCARRNELRVGVRIVVNSVSPTDDIDEPHPVAALVLPLGVDHHEVQPDIWRGQGRFTRLPPRERCAQPTNMLSILADGSVIPCCHLCEGEILLGNIHEQDPLEIWQSARARELRQAFVRGQFAHCGWCNMHAPISLRQRELPPTYAVQP